MRPHPLRTALFSWILLLLAAAGTAGQTFAGIGAAVVPVATGELVVVKVVDGSPAGRGGLLPGDLIIRVDGHPLQGTEFSEVVGKYLWGEPGTRVELVYRRPGRPGEHTVTVERVPMDPARGQTPGVQLVIPDGKKEVGR